MRMRSIVVTAPILIAMLLGIHCGSESAPQRPDILLITIDTLRADSLEPYGAADTLTPSIARLASQGVVYEAATTPMPLTRPAHASILTGLYPDQHGVLTNRQILPEEYPTLAETLRDTGYQTAGFTGIRFLNQKSGLAQGFIEFVAPKDKTEKPRADKVANRAIEWLGNADPETPVFLWVHVYDPHQPYDPPREFRRGIDAELGRRFVKMYVNEDTLDMGEAGLAALEHLYVQARARGLLERVPALTLV